MTKVNHGSLCKGVHYAWYSVLIKEKTDINTSKEIPRCMQIQVIGVYRSRKPAASERKSTEEIPSKAFGRKLWPAESLPSELRENPFVLC